MKDAGAVGGRHELPAESGSGHRCCSTVRPSSAGATWACGRWKWSCRDGGGCTALDVVLILQQGAAADRRLRGRGRGRAGPDRPQGLHPRSGCSYAVAGRGLDRRQVERAVRAVEGKVLFGHADAREDRRDRRRHRDHRRRPVSRPGLTPSAGRIGRGLGGGTESGRRAGRGGRTPRTWRTTLAVTSALRSSRKFESQRDRAPSALPNGLADVDQPQDIAAQARSAGPGWRGTVATTGRAGFEFRVAEAAGDESVDARSANRGGATRRRSGSGSVAADVDVERQGGLPAGAGPGCPAEAVAQRRTSAAAARVAATNPNASAAGNAERAPAHFGSRSRRIRLEVSQRPPPRAWTRRVELVDQRGDRQRGAVGARLGEADREVLAHPVDREAEVELVGDHRLAAVLHLPRLRRALADHVEHALDVEPGALREVDRLRRVPARGRRCRSG